MRKARIGGFVTLFNRMAGGEVRLRMMEDETAFAIEFREACWNEGIRRVRTVLELLNSHPDTRQAAARILSSRLRASPGDEVRDALVDAMFERAFDLGTNTFHLTEMRAMPFFTRDTAWRTDASAIEAHLRQCQMLKMKSEEDELEMSLFHGTAILTVVMTPHIPALAGHVAALRIRACRPECVLRAEIRKAVFSE